MKRKKKGSDGWLMLIAVTHIAKGLVLCAITIGAISLLHKDVEGHAEHWADVFRLDPDNRYIGAILEKLHLIHTKELKEISGLTGLYAALFLTQGTGLALRQRWAEWLTIVATSLFIPVEVYELVHQFTAIRLALLFTNIAVVAFLVWIVRQKQ